MKEKSKDYIKGFEHGVNWAVAMNYLNFRLYEIHLNQIKDEDLKKAIQSLKEGR